MTTLPPYRLRRATLAVILHDSHTDPDEIPHGVSWLRWRGRQMGLLNIGYHIVIERDGESHVTRPLDVMGAHAPGLNHETVGVCLVGGRNGEGVAVDNFTPGQKHRLLKVLAMCQRIYAPNGPLLFVKGHTEMNQRLRRRPEVPCPSLDMDAVRAAHKRFLETNGREVLSI